MARIRSVHPGLFTDEAFVSCSPLARLLAIGLWTEADDQGVFEWKPVTIKMRLLPVDNANIPTLLSELSSADMIRRFEVANRQYGAIRNFRKYQRPKKPNAIHPIPDEFRTYVASGSVGSELDDDEDGIGSELEKSQARRFPKKPEKSQQMEDEGGGCRRYGPSDEVEVDRFPPLDTGGNLSEKGTTQGVAPSEGQTDPQPASLPEVADEMRRHLRAVAS